MYYSFSLVYSLNWIICKIKNLFLYQIIYKNVIQRSAVLNLVLTDHAQGLKEIFESIHIVLEPPTKTIKILGHAVEFFLAFQRTRLHFFQLLGIMRVWGANLLRVARVSAITDLLLSSSP
jgi:hypothetical protein